MSKQPNSSKSKGPTLFDERPWFLFKLPQRLEELREFYERGAIPALYDALSLVRETGSIPPDWIFNGALGIIGDRLKSEKPLGGGNAGEYRRAMRDYRRYQAFQAARNDETPYLEAPSEAAQRLEGTFAAGGEDAIVRSVKKVRKNLKSADSRYRYYQAMKASQELTQTPTLNLSGSKKASGGTKMALKYAKPTKSKQKG